MTPTGEHAQEAPARLRADAQRNQRRILDAAREAVEQEEVPLSLEDVARRAGVGLATVYRRFPGRVELLRALVERYIAEEVASRVRAAAIDDDPWRGLVRGLEEAVATAAANVSLLRAARAAGVRAEDETPPIVELLGDALRGAQAQGRAHPELTPDDLPVIAVMAVAAATSDVARRATGSEQGWHRYLGLLLAAGPPASESGDLHRK